MKMPGRRECDEDEWSDADGDDIEKMMIHLVVGAVVVAHNMDYIIVSDDGKHDDDARADGTGLWATKLPLRLGIAETAVGLSMLLDDEIETCSCEDDDDDDLLTTRPTNTTTRTTRQAMS